MEYMEQRVQELTSARNAVIARINQLTDELNELNNRKWLLNGAIEAFQEMLLTEKKAEFEGTDGNELRVSE